MDRAKWDLDDTRAASVLAGIFMAIGAIWGLFSGDGPFLGATVGGLLFALVMGVGSLLELIGRRKR